MTNHWILDDDKRPIKADLMTWAAFFENQNNRRIAATDIENGVHVSTVFLGVDHQFGKGPPLLFETMIFGGPLHEQCWRYASYDDAAIGHKMAVKKAKAEKL